MTKKLILFLFLSLFVACQLPWQSKPYTIKDGHERMVAILDSIAQFADPEKQGNLSKKHAEILRKALKKTTNDELLAARIRYAETLIRAGQQGQAVLELTTLTRDMGDSIHTQNKPVFELLALAYARMDEVNNNAPTQKPEAYILPFQKGAHYTGVIGLDNAIKVYHNLLRAFPNDAQNQWLFNLAYMNKGIPMDSTLPWVMPAKLLTPPEKAPKFTQQAAKLGIDHAGLAGGVCMDDFDHDGDLDVFVCGQGLREQCQYFEQENGQFTDRTSNAHLDGITGGINAVQADYDNDGDPDILILRGGGHEGGTHPNSLLRNNGNKSFTDVTIEAGLLSFHPTQAADWGDYDGDGWLDLYIANESRDSTHIHPNELYHNNGNGTFTNIATNIGLNFVGYYKGVVWGDANNDHRPDLYLTNWKGNNKLLMNRGSNNNGLWQFQDISVRAGVLGPKYSAISCFFDFNNDGLDDLISIANDASVQDSAAGEMYKDLLGLPVPNDAVKLYQNNGNETFSDVHRTAGLHHTLFAQGYNIGDFDNDGWIDFYVGTGTPDMRARMPNRMFRNTGGTAFEETTMCGTGHLNKGHGIATGDLDNDGDTDIYAVMGGIYEGDIANNAYFQNSGNNNHWLQLILKGTASNREARGAKIAVTVLTAEGKKRTIRATCGTGCSYGGGSRRIEIGLGNAQKILKTVIYWPHFSKKTTELDTLEMDRLVYIEEQ